MAILGNDANLDRATEVEGYKVLPPCVLYGKIGQGGMGAVYRGRHLNLDIDVAVKCLKPGLVGTDDQFVVRFRREARAAAQINHQNVIRVYDVAENQGLHYLIMELVQGETARERVVRKQKLAIGEALEIVYGAAQGLAEAHRKGFIHRDIKPDNIMISSSGQVKVADLGLAKPSMRDEHSSLLSGTNLVMGTPQYMPPEQWENTANVTPAADVWALGATLYYLLVGGEAIQKDSLPRIMQRIMLQPFPDPRRGRSDVPDDVAALIAKATAIAPEERFQNAQELADAMETLATRRAALRDKEAVSTCRVDNLVSPPPAKTLARIKVWLDKHGQDGSDTPTVTPFAARTEGPAGTMVVDALAPTAPATSPVPPTGATRGRTWAVGAGALALVVAAIVFATNDRGRGGAFGEADRLERLGRYEAAIEETKRVHHDDPGLYGEEIRLGRLYAAWAAELAMRGSFGEALSHLERGIAKHDTPALRQQKKDLLERLRTVVEGKLLRETPGSRPVADAARVEFTGRLDDPIVGALRIGGALAVLQGGAFRLTLDATGTEEVPVEAALTTGDVLSLQPWRIVHRAEPAPIVAPSANWSWARSLEVAGARRVANQWVTKDGIVHVTGRPSERAATVRVNGAPATAQWSDTGSFDVAVPLERGLHTIRIDVEKPPRPPLQQEVAIAVIGAPVLEIAPPSKDGDTATEASYRLTLTVDPWTTTVIARRAGALLKSVDVPPGATSVRLDVPLLDGRNEFELEASNVVGLDTKRRVTLHRAVGETRNDAPPAAPELPTIAAVYFVIDDHEIRADNRWNFVKRNARFRVETTGEGAVVVWKDQVLSAGDFVLREGSSLLQRGQIELRAQNAAGTSAESFRFGVKFDDDEPTFEMTVPAAGAGVGVDKPFRVEGRWRDVAGVAEILVNGQLATGAGRKDHGTWSIELPGIRQAVVYDVLFTDYAGNKKRDKLSFRP